MNALRYVLTAPTFLGWLFPLLMLMTGAAHRLHFLDNAVLAAYWRPWVTKFWKYSTTFSRGMVLQPCVSPRTLRHELVHVRQAEDGVLLALVIGILVSLVELDPWWALMWPSGIAWQLPNFLGALLRKGHLYRDTEHERSAYAQTDEHHTTGRSWLEVHLSKPRDW